MSSHLHHVVVVGGGSAGLTVAFGAASAGMDVALIERGPVGGECTWRGCVPSKTLLDIARRAHDARPGTRHGLEFTGEISVDLGAVMGHVHDVSVEVSEWEDEDALTTAGVTVFREAARFVDSHTLELGDGTQVAGHQIVIATGGEPIVPSAFAEVPHITSDTVWSLDELPERLVVIGGGPIGIELSQAFKRLGSDVTLVTDTDRLLGATGLGDSASLCPHAGETIARVLTREGIEVRTGAKGVGAKTAEGGVIVELEDGSTVSGSDLLVAVGQQPAFESLAPHVAGVTTEDGRLVLDDYLRTTQDHIWACGDVANAQFTHMAGAQAAGVLVNLISPRPISVNAGPNRWAVYSDPEIAQIGLSCAEAPHHHRRVEITTLPIRRADRAITQGAEEGFVEVVHSPGGKVYGVTAVGPNASELANQWLPHLGKRMTSAAMAPTIYPTMGSTKAIMGYLWADRIARQSWPGRLGRAVVRWWMSRFKRTRDADSR